MKNFYIALAFLSLIALSGCETVYNGGSGSTRRQENQTRILQENQQRQQMQRDTEVAMATAQSAEVRLNDVDSRLERMENNIRTSSNAGMSDIAAMRNEITSLRAEVAAIRADREQMKNEIIDEISGKVAKMLAAKQAAAPRPSAPAVSQSGYEHKVQSGQTLSAIAQVYGVSVEKIKKANDLKNDVIKVGQTLFIPD